MMALMVVPRRTAGGYSPGADLRVLVHLAHVTVDAQAVALAGIGVSVVGIHHIGAEYLVGGAPVGVLGRVAEGHGGSDGPALLRGVGGEGERHRRRGLSVRRVGQRDAGENNEHKRAHHGKRQFAFCDADLAFGCCKVWMAGADIGRRATGDL